jgi:hypothetical protein
MTSAGAPPNSPQPPRRADQADCWSEPATVGLALFSGNIREQGQATRPLFRQECLITSRPGHAVK